MMKNSELATVDGPHDEAPATLGHNNPPEPTLEEQLADASADLERHLQEQADLANGAPKELTTDQQAIDAAKIAADAGKIRKAFDAQRVEKKAPFLDGQRKVDNHYRAPIERADNIDKGMMKRVTAYNRKKASDAAAEQRKREDEARAIAEAAQRAAAQAAEAGRTEDALASLQEASYAEDQAAAARHETPTAAEATRIQGDGLTISTRTEWTHEITDISKVDLEAIRPFIKPEAIDAACRQFVRINKGTRQIAGVRIFEDLKATRR